MNVEIGAEAALIPEKDYINGIAVAVQHNLNIRQQLFAYAKCTAKTQDFLCVVSVHCLQNF